MRRQYPDIQPYNVFQLDVSGGHSLYVEECGNPDGIPVCFVHGGPGGGFSETDRRFFDPKRWRVVLFDQRGCGRSTPHASLHENTTQHLVADMEAIRERLGIERWALFGGSWGSTLSLVYAQTYPERITGLVLRGIFLVRPEDFVWFYKVGAPDVYPEHHAEFVALVPEDERGDMVRAYHKLLNAEDPALRERAAKVWSVWEARCSTLLPNESLVNQFEDPPKAVAIAQLEVHYFIHDCFLKPGQILDNMARIRHLPGYIVQGRYDMVCPPTGAWALHQAWPEAQLTWVADAGHNSGEPGTTDALVNATDDLARRLKS